MMTSAFALVRTTRSASRSVMEGPPAGGSHLRGKALEPHEIAKALLDGELEVLPQKGPVRGALGGDAADVTASAPVAAVGAHFGDAVTVPAAPVAVAFTGAVLRANGEDRQRRDGAGGQQDDHDREQAGGFFHGISSFDDELKRVYRISCADRQIRESIADPAGA
jgi:hypothetical protein